MQVIAALVRAGLRDIKSSASSSANSTSKKLIALPARRSPHSVYFWLFVVVAAIKVSEL